jgi:hypothetical protein
MKINLKYLLLLLAALALITYAVVKTPALGIVLACGAGAIIIGVLGTIGFNRFGYREPLMAFASRQSGLPGVSLKVLTRHKSKGTAIIQVAATVPGYLIVTISGSLSQRNGPRFSGNIERPIQVELPYNGGRNHNDVAATFFLYKDEVAHRSGGKPLVENTVCLHYTEYDGDNDGAGIVLAEIAG